MINELLTQSNISSLNLIVSFQSYRNSDGKIIGGFFTIIDMDKGKIVSRFILEQMKGCNGICISRKVSISEDYRGKGYGSMLCNYREKLASFLSYSVIMCSVVSSNEPQTKIMAKNGWQTSFKFNNKKTTNDVIIYFKNL
jgi:GNAT superfamily N-acetyltransferase